MIREPRNHSHDPCTACIIPRLAPSINQATFLRPPFPFHLFGIETSRAPLTVTHGSVRKKNTWADISYIFPYTVFIVENITLCMSSIFPFQLLSLLALCPVNPYPYGFFPKRWLCHPLLPLCIWEGVREPGWGMAMAYLDIGWGVPFSHFPPLLLLSFLYAVQIYEI